MDHDPEEERQDGELEEVQMARERVADAEPLETPPNGHERGHVRPESQPADEAQGADIPEHHEDGRRREERTELGEEQRRHVEEAPHEPVGVGEDGEAEATKRREVEVDASEARERVVHLVHRGQQRPVVVPEERVVPVDPETERQEDRHQTAPVEPTARPPVREVHPASA